jgi:hypothetical protein
VVTPNDVATDALVDAILLSSRALVALSARSIASAHGVTLPQFRMLVVLEASRTSAGSLRRWMLRRQRQPEWSTGSWTRAWFTVQFLPEIVGRSHSPSPRRGGAQCTP